MNHRRRFLLTSSIAGLCFLASPPIPRGRGSVAGAFRDPLGGGQGRSARFYDVGGEGGGAGGGTGGTGGGTEAGGSGGVAEPTVAELQQRLRAAETQIGTLTTERDGFKSKAEKYEGDNQTEAEKQAAKLTNAEKERDAAKNAVKAAQVTIAIEREARKLNIVDEDAATRLIDMNAVQFDKDNKPTNIAILLTQLVKDKPYLVRLEEARTNGISNPPRGRTAGDTTVAPGRDRLKNAYGTTK